MGASIPCPPLPLSLPTCPTLQALQETWRAPEPTEVLLPLDLLTHDAWGLVGLALP